MNGMLPANAVDIGVVLVVIAAIIEGLAQVCLKVGAHAVRRAQVWITLGVALFVVEVLFYTAALRLLDVSVAYPISALNYAAVVAASSLFLRERGGPRRWWGVALIVAGAALSAPGA